MHTAILLNRCAQATSAREVGFRTGPGPSEPRTTAVVALDTGAAALIQPLISGWWPNTAFLRPRLLGAVPATPEVSTLTTFDERPVRIADAVAGLDLLFMIATSDSGAGIASMLGSACDLHGITTAGLVLDSGPAGNDAVTALRPHLRVLFVSTDIDDAAALLAAVGG